VSNNRFPILELLFGPKAEASGECWPDKVVTLQVNSTYSATKSHKKKLLNRLVADYSPWLSEYLQLLLSLRPRYIFLWELFSNDDILWYLINVFTQEVASDSTQMTIAFG
jgi:hypothetical protein